MQLIDKKFSGSVKANWFLALFILGLVGRAPAVAQTPGTFNPTGYMSTVRANHTATLLPDGRVLIAGGTTGLPSSITTTAELYDPTTGLFTSTGEMTVPRRSHAATVLPDGRVLIAGGTGPFGPLESTELYDSSTGIFTRTGDMVSGGNASGGGQAILLRTGKVLIAVNFSAQLFDPVAGTFSATGPYADSTFWVYTATMLTDGRVLLTGCGGPSCDIGVTELYDPGINTFSRTGPMSEWYSVNTATLLMNGQVLFVGTSDDGGPSEAEVYDPASGTFAGVGDTIWPHDFGTATLLGDGTVLFTAAQLPGLPITSGAELYDPVLGTFVSAGKMTTLPNKATLLHDGKVLITGSGSSLSQTSSAELYDPGVPMLWQQAITAMKVAAGGNSLNFWQWAWFWQRSPAFPGAPTGFGAIGSIDNTPGLIEKNIAAGGGNGLQNTSAESWVLFYRRALATDPWQRAIASMQYSAGTNALNFWQWAWYWQRSPPFVGAPAGFGLLGSIDNAPGTIDKIIAAGGGNSLAVVSAEQWGQYFRQAQ